MIAWKRLLKRLNEEYEVARKKRCALDSLLDAGKISQSTYDMFSLEVSEAITEVERQQKALAERMKAKMVELEEQIKTLEILLANFELQHAVGEVDEEVYQREVNVLSMGLDVSRQELATIKAAVDELSGGGTVPEESSAEKAACPQEEKVAVEYVDVKDADNEKTVEELAEQQPLEASGEKEQAQTS
ncbi:MAG: CdvA-like protein [Candidatus Bathyarchaeia archaeon]